MKDALIFLAVFWGIVFLIRFCWLWADVKEWRDDD